MKNTCPACDKEFLFISTKSDGTTTYKIYKHEARKCKVLVTDNLQVKPIIKKAFVDMREVDANIHNMMARLANVVIVEALENGDIYFDSVDFLIERKSIADWRESMIDERIYDQVKRGVENHEHYAIGISGSISEYANSKQDVSMKTPEIITRQALGFAASLQANTPRKCNGKKIENISFFENDAQLCYWAAKKAASYEKIKHKDDEGIEEKPYIKIINVPDSGVRMVNMLRCVPLIDDHYSRVIYEEFGSIEELLKRPIDLMKIPGIGEKRYKSVVDTLSGKADGELSFKDDKNDGTTANDDI